LISSVCTDNTFSHFARDNAEQASQPLLGVEYSANFLNRPTTSSSTTSIARRTQALDNHHHAPQAAWSIGAALAAARGRPSGVR
jgi:hypothetical protein